MLADAAKEVGSKKEERGKLWNEVGRSVGKVTASMVGLDHPTAHREFAWDLCECERVIRLRSEDVSSARRPLLDTLLARYQKDIVPLLPQLRKSIVHNDPNDYNLVVSSD